MSIQHDLAKAETAIFKIRQAAKYGDAEAVKALRDLALKAVDDLTRLTEGPHDLDHLPLGIREGAKLARHLARHSHRWPCALDSLTERRRKQLEAWNQLEVGSAIALRREGKNRGLDYEQVTGFALDLFMRLEAVRTENKPCDHHLTDIFPGEIAPENLTEKQREKSWQNLAVNLPPLSKESLSQWTEAAMRICHDDSEGDLANFDFPKILTVKAGRMTDENGHLRTIESALKEKISHGLKSLIP